MVRPCRPGGHSRALGAPVEAVLALRGRRGQLQLEGRTRGKQLDPAFARAWRRDLAEGLCPLPHVRIPGTRTILRPVEWRDVGDVGFSMEEVDHMNSVPSLPFGPLLKKEMGGLV